MKKVLLVFVLLFSLGLAQAQEVDGGKFESTIKKGDLPVGASFALLPLDGSPMVTGVVKRSTLQDLPKRTKFILSVNGKVTKYCLLPLPPKKRKR